ncbi:MAG: SpoIIE family protein phosphatase, partial [Acidobacteria bacterium]|nr:SpoIIE family protein phosphatase [Acidobacteriota bacterium]
KILTPLSQLNLAMTRILHGDLDQRVDIRSGDEIGDMAETFNFMAQGLRHKAGIEQFNRKLVAATDLSGLAGMISAQITDALQSPRGFLFLKEKTDTEDLTCTASRAFKGKKGTLTCSPELKDFLLENPAPRILSAPESLPPALAKLSAGMKIGENAVITPIHVLDDIIGFFILDSRKDGSGYSETELLFINTLISQAGFVIENALLLEERTEKERLKREFEIARRVQQNLLPSGQPDMAGLDVDGFCLPAAEIGGDYYDFFRLDRNRIGIVIADVTGKGTSAAFYMAVIKGLMVSLVHMHDSPEAVLREINRRLWDWMDRRIFITMGYAIFDTEQGRCEFGRAGHTGLLVRRRKGGVDCFAPPGIGLGLEGGRIFEKTIVRQDIPLAAGDVLLLFTDGISETMNAAGREFGEKRLMAVLKNSADQDAKGIRQSIVRAVNRHRGKAAQHDDITLVTVRVTEQTRKAVAKAV